jgi:hypothetical protein
VTGSVCCPRRHSSPAKSGTTTSFHEPSNENIANESPLFFNNKQKHQISIVYRLFHRHPVLLTIIIIIITSIVRLLFYALLVCNVMSTPSILVTGANTGTFEMNQSINHESARRRSLEKSGMIYHAVILILPYPFESVSQYVVHSHIKSTPIFHYHSFIHNELCCCC